MAAPVYHVNDQKIASVSSSNGSLSADQPDNVSEGDLILFIWITRNRNINPDTVPNELTFLHAGGYADSTAAAWVRVYAKIATDSEPSSYDFVADEDTWGHQQRMISGRVTGHHSDVNDLLSGTPTSNNSGTSSNISIVVPGIDLQDDNTLIFGVGVKRNITQTVTLEPGFTTIDSNEQSHFSYRVGTKEEEEAGITDDMTVSSENSQRVMGAMFAIKPPVEADPIDVEIENSAFRDSSLNDPSFTYDNPEGASLLLVFAAATDFDELAVMDNVTYDGVSLEEVRSDESTPSPSDGYITGGVYVMSNPPSGEHTLAASWDGGVSNRRLHVYSLSGDNLQIKDHSATTDQAFDDNGVSVQVNAGSDDLILDYLAWRNSSRVVDSIGQGQVQQLSDGDPTRQNGTSVSGGDGTVTMTQTAEQSDSSNACLYYGVSIASSLASPTDLIEVETTETSITVSWTDQTDGEASHRVYYRVGGSSDDWQVAAEVEPGVTQATISALDPGSYEIAVSAFTADQESELSDSIVATIEVIELELRVQVRSGDIPSQDLPITDLRYIVLNGPLVGESSEVIAQGVDGAIDENREFVLEVTDLGVNAEDLLYLYVTDSDGTVSPMNHLGGPVEVMLVEEES